VALRYRTKEHTTLYHDFAEDVLPTIIESFPKSFFQKNGNPPVLINVNPYIRSEETKKKLIEYTKQYTTSYFFPAEI
jgi:hypothetical protein